MQALASADAHKGEERRWQAGPPPVVGAGVVVGIVVVVIIAAADEEMVSDGSLGLLTDRRLRSEIDTLRKTLILGKDVVWESRQELVGLLGVLMAEQSRRVSRFIAPEVGWEVTSPGKPGVGWHACHDRVVVEL